MGWIFPGLVPLLFPSNRASDIPRKRECDGRPTIRPRPAWRGHDEDKWHSIDNSPPLISQAHDWKDFTQVLEIFQSMREYWGVRYCSLFAPLWAVWGNLRLFVGSCPNSYRPPSVMPTSALPKALSFKSFSHHKWEASRWKTKPLRKHIMTEKLFNWPICVILVFLC